MLSIPQMTKEIKTLLSCTVLIKQNKIHAKIAYRLSSPNPLGICTLRSKREEHIGQQSLELRAKLNLEIVGNDR